MKSNRSISQFRSPHHYGSKPSDRYSNDNHNHLNQSLNH